jgi:hypothetical protein
MNQIIVGFSRPKKWFSPFSWLIRLCTWTPYSHAYIRYENTYANRNVVFQASGLAVNFMNQEMFNGKEVVCAEFAIPISDSSKLSTVQFAIDSCGTPYGLGQVVGFGWVLFMRIFGKSVENPFYSGSSYFCSELVADILAELKVPGDTLDPSTASPKDVLEFLVAKGYKPVTNG